MRGFESLEARIQVLEDIEAIRKLKAKYFHSIDRKQWGALTDCFTQDAVWESGKRKVEVRGAGKIVELIRSIEGPDNITNTHQGHDPEIEIISAVAAKGSWELSHYRYDSGEATEQTSAAFYEDDYVKLNGAWKIRHCRIVPIYLCESDGRRASPAP